MSPQTLGQWAENITQKIYLALKNYEWRHGIKIFYGPVREDFSLAIISYQPGGSFEDYGQVDMCNFKREDFRLPEINEYIKENNRMARRVRELFASCNRLDLLKMSITFPLIFFRAPTVAIWADEIGAHRLQAEKLCINYADEILKKLQPAKILVFGISTYDLMKEKILLPFSKPEKEIRSERDNQRIVIMSENADFKLFATSHPVSARITNTDRQRIKEFFGEWVAGNF